MSAGHTAVTDEVSDVLDANEPGSDVVEMEPCGLPEHEDCGIRDVLDRLGDTWSVLAVVELATGRRRIDDTGVDAPGRMPCGI